MNVLLKGEFFLTDNELSLVGALQRKGINVKYLVPIDCWRLKASLFNIKKQYPHTGIYPASVYEEFKIYSDYVDLRDVYVINRPKGLLHPLSIWLYVKLLLFIIKFKPDVIHYTWQQVGLSRLLYCFKAKKVMTVHDPLPHSNADTADEDKSRRRAFKAADSFVLLNNKMTNLFAQRYNITYDRIFNTHLGAYDYLEQLPYPSFKTDTPYILFFGQIAPYKGVEYLLNAMTQVHERHPEVKLIIAGGGKFYFDITKYKNLDYIDIRNSYIPMDALVPLLKGSLFTVAPYKDATQSGVLYNAFSLGVPVIATNVGALPEMVKNEENGLLVPPCDSNALAGAITRLLDNPDMLETMRSNIRGKWIPSMNWDDIADVFIDSYKATK